MENPVGTEPTLLLPNEAVWVETKFGALASTDKEQATVHYLRLKLDDEKPVRYNLSIHPDTNKWIVTYCPQGLAPTGNNVNEFVGYYEDVPAAKVASEQHAHSHLNLPFRDADLPV